MVRFNVVLIALAAVIALALATPSFANAPGGSNTCSDPVISFVIDGFNARRAEESLPPFSCNEEAVDLATAKSDEMCEMGELSITNDFLRATCTELGWLRSDGFCAGSIAFQFGDADEETAQGTLDLWFASTGSLSYITSPVATMVGVGYFICMDSGRVYYTALYGA